MDEIAVHGYKEMSAILLKVVARVLGALPHDERTLIVNDAEQLGCQYELTRDAFRRLADDNFIERVAPLETTGPSAESKGNVENGSGHANGKSTAPKSRVPKFVSNESERFVMPMIKIKGAFLVHIFTPKRI